MTNEELHKAVKGKIVSIIYEEMQNSGSYQEIYEIIADKVLELMVNIADGKVEL